MKYILHRFNGFPQMTLREKREIFDVPSSPETPPSMPPPTEAPEQIEDPDDASKVANDKIQGADQAFQARAQLLDQAEQNIKNLKTVAEDATNPDPMNLEAAFGATENTLGQLDAETQSAAIPPELQGYNLGQLIDKVRSVNKGAADKADAYLKSLAETRESLKADPAAAQRFDQIEKHSLLLLQKHLALQLMPQQGNERVKQTIAKNLEKAKQVADGVSLSKMTVKQKNMKIAQLMLLYGVDVMENGDKLEVSAPADTFTSMWNRLQGILMLFSALTEKETGEKAYKGPTNVPPEGDGKPSEDGKDAPEVETELQKELNDKTIPVVRAETQANLDKATKELDGDMVTGTRGLRREKEDLEHIQVDKKNEIARLENEVKSETDPTAKEAKQKELNTAQGDLNALTEKIKTIDSNIKLTEDTQAKMKTKLEEIKKLEEAADKEKLDMNTQLTKMHDDLGKAPLDTNPDAQIIRTMISGITAERVTDKLQMKLMGVDDVAWAKGVDVAIKNGIDRKTFDRNADGSLASSAQFRRALTKLMEKMNAGVEALDKGVKEFTDKGATPEDAQAAAKLNADYPNLKLDFKDGNFILPESSDVDAGHALVRSTGLNARMKQVLMAHINTAMKDISTDRGGKMFKSYMTDIYSSGPWADPAMHDQIVQLKKSGVPVSVEAILTGPTANVSVVIDKTKAKESDLYKSTEPGKTINPALKTFIDS